MPDHDVQTPRRKFLKATGAATIGLAASGGMAHAAEQVAPSERPEPSRADSLDRGLWITWYDLPDQGRDDYLSWLHETYLPGLLKRPGYLWAAHYATQDVEGANTSCYHHVDDPQVGKGYRYILLVAGADANVFGNRVPSQIHAALPEESRKMLAVRAGERVNIMTEAGRRQGRAARAYQEGLLGTPCIQIGSFNCPTEYEEEMHAGYVQQRLPTVCGTESCVMTRKLNSVAGWAKHGILYEFASKEGYERDYAGAVARSPLGFGRHSVVPMLIHAPNGPNSAVRIWPPLPKD
jgi:hypothetical protein